VATSLTKTDLDRRDERSLSRGFRRRSESALAEVAAREAFCELLERNAIETLRSETPYAHYFREVKILAQEECLILTGRVCSFYLKSVLQNRLSRAFPAIQIDNRVLVVSSQGLSSVPGEDHCHHS